MSGVPGPGPGARVVEEEEVEAEEEEERSGWVERSWGIEKEWKGAPVLRVLKESTVRRRVLLKW